MYVTSRTPAATPFSIIKPHGGQQPASQPPPQTIDESHVLSAPQFFEVVSSTGDMDSIGFADNVYVVLQDMLQKVGHLGF